MHPLRLIAALAATSLTLMAAPVATSPRNLSDGNAIEPSRASAPQASLREVLGSSGNLRAVIGMPDALAENPALRPLLAGVPLDAPGVRPLALPAPDGDPIVVVTLQSFAALENARLDRYRVGQWPAAGPATGDERYAPPEGFIAVTADNAFTPVSKRFRLRDFLTHDQQDVWPKVLVLEVALLDKLELIGDALERRGLPHRLHVMSGFRTPQYNARGVGEKGGRASRSRHMYGDAADVFVDGNEDGMMDDLDRDGRITRRDAEVLHAVADEVERLHPHLAGGLSAYAANAAHGPFVHVDTRGVRARW
jgi:hypothetical protein